MPKEGKQSRPNKKVLIVRILGSSVSVVGSTVVSRAGGLTSCIASIVQFILDRLEDNDINFLEQLVNIIKARGLTPRERLEAVNTLFKKVSCIAGEAAKESAPLAPGSAIAQGCKAAKAAKAADNTRKAASISTVLEEMLKCTVVRVNGLSILFSLVDLIDACVRYFHLSKSS